MNDFRDLSIFNIWQDLLKENNYNKKESDKILGIVILYLAKLRLLYNI